MQSTLLTGAIVGAFSDLPLGTKLLLVGIVIALIYGMKGGKGGSSGKSGGGSSSGAATPPAE